MIFLNIEHKDGRLRGKMNSKEVGEHDIDGRFEQDGTISFAQSEGGDYRNRVEPTAILTALKK